MAGVTDVTKSTCISVIETDLHRYVLSKTFPDMGDLLELGLLMDDNILIMLKTKLGRFRAKVRTKQSTSNREQLKNKPDIHLKLKPTDSTQYVTDIGLTLNKHNNKEYHEGASLNAKCLLENSLPATTEQLDALAIDDILKQEINMDGKSISDVLKKLQERFKTSDLNGIISSEGKTYCLNFCFKLSKKQQIYPPYKLEFSPDKTDDTHYTLYTDSELDVKICNREKTKPFWSVEIKDHNFGTDVHYDWKLCGMKFVAGADPTWRHLYMLNPDSEVLPEILVVIDALYYANGIAITEEEMKFAEETIKEVARCNASTDLFNLKPEFKEYIINTLNCYRNVVDTIEDQATIQTLLGNQLLLFYECYL